ncbi:MULTISPECIES: hypothetical protein [unclassified Arthrobacter]|uniref:hypothetical protein n=1 Tax=unclassified Pseudarthrobacter TaxID=2647000 RepID=UPI0033985F73
MSTPVPPPVPNEPEPGNQPPAPRYGENSPPFGQPTPPAPQYGQNAPQYGQQTPPAPQYGQNAPQYGQQTPPAPQYGQNTPPYGQSPYAQYPSEQPQATESNGVPRLVNISFWLLIGAGVVYVISLLMGIGMLDDPQIRNAFDDAMLSSGATPADFNYENFKGILAGSLVVFAIIGAGLYALVAFFVRKGKNWARILGTVFAALSIFGLFGVPSFGTLGTLAGIAAIVLLYLPAAAPYFRKPQPFASPYGAPGSTPGNPYGQ